MEPMLCQDFEVNGVLNARAKDMSDGAITEAYRELVEKRLSELAANGFVSERKYDGTRLIVEKKWREVTLTNRHGAIYTVRLPEIVKAAQKLEGDFILDGEAIYVNPKTGREEFTPCQSFIRTVTHLS